MLDRIKALKVAHSEHRRVTPPLGGSRADRRAPSAGTDRSNGTSMRPKRAIPGVAGDDVALRDATRRSTA
jgi:hypothetical protein